MFSRRRSYGNKVLLCLTRAQVGSTYTVKKLPKGKHKGGGRAGKIVYLVLGALGVPMT